MTEDFFCLTLFTQFKDYTDCYFSQIVPLTACSTCHVHRCCTHPNLEEDLELVVVSAVVVTVFVGVVAVVCRRHHGVDLVGGLVEVHCASQVGQTRQRDEQEQTRP